jgi:ADP-ribose pyrophosphatase YjhB (NUDIX family)
MTDRFVVVPASYVYLLRTGDDGRDEVLLQLRGDVPFMPFHWAAAAAGHVERGETAYDAARREAREELDVDVVDLTFEFAMSRTGRDLPIDERVDFFFTSRLWRGEPRIVETTKCAELRWVPLDELPEPTVPHEAYAMSHLGGAERYLTFGF